MLTSAVARIITGIALFCATLAWGGWVYLNTVADPHRVERVALAVLADSDARAEIADPLADQVVEVSGLDPSLQPGVRDAVADVLADPRFAANVTGAVGAAHARTFGVPDPRPATIDGAVFVAAVRDHLSVASPELAARIPTDIVGDLQVPEHEIPFAAGIRSFAETATNWLAAAAIGLLAFAFLTGDRARTLRRFGIWAISAGLAWVIGPRIVVALAGRWARSGDATLAAALTAATSTVTAVATVLVVVGVGSVVGSFALRATSLGVAALGAGAGRVGARPVERRPRRAPRPRQGVEPLSPSPSPPFAPSAPTTRLPAAAPLATTRLPATPPRPPVDAPTTVLRGPDLLGVAAAAPAPPVPEPEVDPWAFFGTAPSDPPHERTDDGWSRPGDGWGPAAPPS